MDAGIRIIIDIGTYDLIVNEIGTNYWTEELNWKYIDDWIEIKMENYKVNDNVVGKIKSGYNLTFVTVNDAAHWVIEDKPEVVLSLILSLTYGEESATI